LFSSVLPGTPRQPVEESLAQPSLDLGRSCFVSFFSSLTSAHMDHSVLILAAVQARHHHGFDSP
jgi:hypothetical protein